MRPAIAPVWSKGVILANIIWKTPYTTPGTDLANGKQKPDHCQNIATYNLFLPSGRFVIRGYALIFPMTPLREGPKVNEKPKINHIVDNTWDGQVLPNQRSNELEEAL